MLRSARSCIAVACAGRERRDLPDARQASIRAFAPSYYSADEVYRLYGYVGLTPGSGCSRPMRTCRALSGGDLEGLTYSAHGNVLTFKPKVAYDRDELAVTTNRRRYYFEYSASARRPESLDDPVMYAVRFTYPPAHGEAAMA